MDFAFRRRSHPIAAAAKRAGFAVAARLFSARRGTVPAEPRKILVLQLQQIGDSVIFTPTLRALARRFPAARIDMLVNRVTNELYSKCPYVARRYLAPGWHSGPGGSRVASLLPLLRELRRERYDLAVADIAQASFKYALVAWLTGARERAGFDLLDRGFLHTIRVPVRQELNVVEINLDLARTAGAQALDPREELYFDSDDASHAARLAEATGSDGQAPLVVMHVGANWQSRTWYEDRWAAVADALVDRFHVSRARVRVRKPEVRLAAEAEYTAATVERGR